MVAMVNLFLPVVLKVVGSLLATGLSALLAYVMAKIAACKKSDHVKSLLERAAQLAFEVVNSTSQVFVDKVKEAGKWNEETAKAALAAALASLKEHIGAKGLDELKVVLGCDDGGLEKLLVTLLESAVKQHK
jgi:hypothetical protein